MVSDAFHDRFRGQRGVQQQRASCGLRIRAAAADGDDAELGLEHVARRR
jgi:hypothetical protein